MLLLAAWHVISPPRPVEREVGLLLRVGGSIVREIVHQVPVEHSGASVLCLHLVRQGICVLEEEVSTVPILLLHDVVVKSSSHIIKILMMSG